MAEFGGRARLLRSGKFWLWFLGISAAMTMLEPSIVMMAAISIIGIPIAVFLAAAPFLFLVASGTWIISRRLGSSVLAVAAGAAVTLALLAIPPVLVNRSLESRGKSFVAEDHDDGTKPAGEVIAIRGEAMTVNRRDVNCTGFCQRALLNGVAKRILVVKQDISLAIDPATEVDSLRMERRATCPPVKLPEGNDPIKIDSERQGQKGKRADELMQIEIAKGNCLIVETAPLGLADTILSVGAVNRGASEVTAGLSLLADTVSADRITVHDKQGPLYKETFRQTYVVIRKLMPFYAPTGWTMTRALARYRETINVPSPTYEKPDWSGFLTARMGYDLALRAGDAQNETRMVLKEAMNRQSLDAAAAKVGADFIRGFTTAINRKIEGEDLELAQRLMTDERFPVTSGAWTTVRYAKGATPDYFEAIGASMFARLRAFAAAEGWDKYAKWHDQAQNVDRVIRALPRETILRHRDDLEWLARQDVLRVPVHGALKRLSEFGATGAPTLLWLIDDAQRFRGKPGENWERPYLSGLVGLCNLGLEGAAMIQPLYDRLDSGVVSNRGSYGDLAITTLVGMGAKPEDVWLHARPTGRDPGKTMDDERRSFDKTVLRAQEKVECPA